MGSSGKVVSVPTTIIGSGSGSGGSCSGPNHRLIRRLSSSLSVGYSSSSDTSLSSSSSSSDASSVCSSLSSSTGFLSAIKTKKKKKRVRFNDNNKFFFGGNSKSVNCDVQTFQKAAVEQDEHRRELFWKGSDLRARRRQEARVAEGDAEEYLSRAFHVFLQVEKLSKNNNGQDDTIETDLVRFAATLDDDHRGLERWHGPSGLDRATQCEQIVRDVVRMYRRCKKKAPNHHAINGKKQQEIIVELNERVRRYAHKLNQNTRNLAVFYGKVDELVVRSNNDANNSGDLDQGSFGQQ